MTSPSPCSASTETASINVPGRAAPVPFRFYTSSKGHVINILQGLTYPLVPNIGSVNTILDVGANVGSASVMLSLAYPNAVVHALEPAPTALALLRENAAAFPKLLVYGHGLHNHTGTVKLFRSRWDPMSGSVLPSSENTADYDEVSFCDAADWLVRQSIGPIDILKIDTEGCEVPLIAALGQHALGARVIYLEYHSDSDRQRLDATLGSTHVLAYASARQPHRGDVCYVHKSTAFARQSESLAISPSQSDFNGSIASL